jgi:hypothetical protein
MKELIFPFDNYGGTYIRAAIRYRFARFIGGIGAKTGLARL